MEGTRPSTPPRQPKSSISQSKYMLTPAGKSYINANEDRCTLIAQGISYSGNLSLVKLSDNFIILSSLPEYLISTIGSDLDDPSEWGPRWLSNKYIFLRKIDPMIDISDATIFNILEEVGVGAAAAHTRSKRKENIVAGTFLLLPRDAVEKGYIITKGRVHIHKGKQKEKFKKKRSNRFNRSKRSKGRRKSKKKRKSKKRKKIKGHKGN